MRIKIFKTAILFASALFIVSCAEDRNEGYTGDNYIYFDKEYKKDSTLFTFAYDATITTAKIGVQLNIASDIASNDRSYTIRYLESESSAKPGVHFVALPEQNIFRAGHDVDTLFIELKKTPDMDSKMLMAVFEIVESSDFLPGLPDNLKARVVVTNLLARPAWWDGWHESSGLGTYSESKYRLFIQITGEHDLDYENREDMDYSLMRAKVLEFKYHLLANPTEDEDGNLMKVMMNG